MKYQQDIFKNERLGRCVRNVGHGRNASDFRMSCVCMVCFLSKSTQFHDMQTERQIILVHFLILISHKSAVFAKSDSLFSISLRLLSLCY